METSIKIRPQRKRKLRPDRFIEWTLFQFRVDSTLFCVPSSWIISSKRVDKQGKVINCHQCWWPTSGSEAERNLSILIQNQSQPDKENWNQMPGRMLGEYDSRESAERALKQKDGTLSTSDGEQVLGRKNQKLKSTVCSKSPAVLHDSSMIGNQCERLERSVCDVDTDNGTSLHTESIPALDQAKGISSKYSITNVSCTNGSDEAGALHGIVERLDRLERKVDVLLHGNTNIDSSPEDEDGKPYTPSIVNMSSSSQHVRAKSSAVSCLHDLGFPVSSFDSLIERNEMLKGSDPRSIRRRNALANCLLSQVPKHQCTLTSSIRQCLYSMAPASIWQFFCGQGQSGSKKTSFADEMTIIYKALVVAVTQQTQSSLKATSSGISEVLKTMPNRKNAINYRSSVGGASGTVSSMEAESSDSTLLVSETDDEDLE